MQKIYDCLIVGAGIAGLTATAYLSKNGYDVLLCEQSSKVGGLIGTYKRDDVIFDQGIRAFENSGILKPMLDAFDIKLDMLDNPVKIGIKEDFVNVSSKSFLDDYEKLLTKNFPDENENIKKIIKKIKKVMDQMDVLYEIDNPILIEGKYELDYLLKTLLPWLKRYKKSMKGSKEFQVGVFKYLERFTKNQALIDMISQHFFLDTPAFFALSYFGFYREYKYPKGGTGVLVKKLENYILNNKTEIKLNTKIKKVDMNEKCAYTDQNETIHFKNIIWASNQKSLYDSLVTKDNKKTLKLREITSKSRGSDSVLTLNVISNYELNLIKNKLGPHAFFTPKIEGLTTLEKFHNAIDKDEWVRTFLNLTTYEVSIPKLRDINLAPSNHIGLIISTLFSYDVTKYYKDLNKMDHLKKLVSDEILNIFEKNLFNNFKASIIYQNISTPLTIEQFTLNLDGSITGWSYANKEMASITDFKHIKKASNTPIKNLYQCGQWTFSPAGMPTSILTAKVAADLVMKGLKR